MDERWVAPFLSMLNRMEYLGNIGSSRMVAIYADGDGDFHPHFKWDDDLPPERAPNRDTGGDYIYDADGIPVQVRAVRDKGPTELSCEHPSTQLDAGDV